MFTTTPLDTLMALTHQIRGLDEVQGWVDLVRASAPTDQTIQLEMDRRQAEIDEKRARIALLMLDISSRN